MVGQWELCEHLASLTCSTHMLLVAGSFFQKQSCAFASKPLGFSGNDSRNGELIAFCPVFVVVPIPVAVTLRFLFYFFFFFFKLGMGKWVQRGPPSSQ